MTSGRAWWTAVLLSVTVLAGCDGGTTTSTTTPTDPVQAFSDNTTFYRQMSFDVVGDITTKTPGILVATKNVPTGGTATLDGYAALFVGLPGNSIPSVQLVSPAEVTADFAAATVTGAAKEFTGRNVDPSTGNYTTAPAATYTGEINLSGGSITAPNSITATASGTLKGGGNTIAATSLGMSGMFYGTTDATTDLSAVAINGSSDGSTSAVTLNTVDATAALNFVAEK